MSDNKTKPSSRNVNDFLNNIQDTRKKEDSIQIDRIMRDISGSEPVMWGEYIIGYGNYRFKYKTGREGDWFVIGFSPRKQNLTIYLNYGFEEKTSLTNKLGKFKTGKACLYIKSLNDIDLDVLRELIKETYEEVKKNSHV